MHEVALLGRLPVLRLLLERRADVDAKEGSGIRPLHEAAAGGHAEVVEELLWRRADVQMPSLRRSASLNPGAPPLHAAAAAGHLQAVRLLLNARAAADARDAENCGALFVAAEEGWAPLVTELLHWGASISATSSDMGFQALHAATMRGHLSTVQMLLAARSNALAVDAQGSQPSFLAQYEGHAEVLAFLSSISAGSSQGTVREEL